MPILKNQLNGQWVRDERDRERAHKKELQNKDAGLGFPAIHSLFL